VNHITGTAPTDVPTQAQDASPPARPAGATPAQDASPPDQPASAPPAPDAAPAPEPARAPSDGFQSRGRARRRARFLRKARELAYRDLGGLVFNLHRFGARNDALVLAKLTTLTQIDGELRAIEGVLGERRPITVLREAGITACPRCAAIHGSDDSFCPNCGLSMGRHVDLPIAGAAAAPPAPPSGAAAPPAPPPAPAAAVLPAVPGPVDPTRAPAPAHPPDATMSAPRPLSTAPAGRSPAPPANSGTHNASPESASSPSPPPSSPIPVVPDDGPTEILRPPASAS
jgi:hypothetical protein